VRLGVAAAVVDGELVPGDVELIEGRVARVGLGGRGEGTALPGLVDLQVNGFAGIDLLAADAAAVSRLGDALLRTGVTAYQPTLISSPPERTLEALAEIAGARGGARVLGVHLEGPFLSPRHAGAHPVEHLRTPDAGLLRTLLEPGGVSTVTLAPELPGAHELVDEAVRRGVCVSLGHSAATAAEAEAAFARGARTVTHLFNAMRSFSHREPGLAGAALARGDVTVQLIVDGVHLAPGTVLLAWRAARGRLAVVSDAIAAAGLGEGAYRIGEAEVEVRDGAARRGDGTLAGGVETLAEAVRRMCELGVPLPEAADAATRVPARVLGRDDVGRLAPGATADVVVLDDNLAVTRVLRAGKD
jgi:N-acetylglucosamine-6-phosphate deacetylase